MGSAYLRFPHVHHDSLTFVAADDIWLGGTGGGRAWRLTNDRAPVSRPRFSPDGSHIAFVSHRDGHPEVMVIDLGGGSARRLTWWGGSNTMVLGWTGEGRVLVASNAGEANMRHLVVKAVDLDGGVERLRYGPAGAVALRPDGAAVISTPAGRPAAHWKRYRGGTAARLWLDTGDGQWRRLLPDETAPLTDPMWRGETLLFVSDMAATFPDAADEQANLWAWDSPGQGRPRQITHQGVDEGYVRDAATDGASIVWSSRGDVWLLDDLDRDPVRVNLSLPGAAPVAFDAEPTKNLDAVAPDHGGDASLVAWRGNAFWLSHREGPARAIAADAGVRVREPILLGRTGKAVMASDVKGEDCLEVRDLTGTTDPQRLAAGQLGRVLHLASDPPGQRVVVISHDGAIRLVTLADASVRDLGRSEQGEATSPTFSPDGRYLMWTVPTADEASLHALRLVDLHGDGRVHALTSGRFHDHSPVFSDDGKYVVFLSDRTFDPAYDNHEFALSFTGSTRPWLIPLAATEPAPFGPSADGWRISEAGHAAGRAGSGGAGTTEGMKDDDGAAGPRQQVTGAPAAPPSPDLDATGAEERITPFPVPSGTYKDLRTVKGGVVWISVAGEAGVLGSRRAGVAGEPVADTLQLWSFGTRKVTTIVDKVDSYAVSGDGERLVVRHKDEVTVVPADRKVEEEDDQAKVSVDLKRLRWQVDPAAEWQQMFDENARLMRDHFWRADMDGVDWAGVVARYRPLVDRLRSHDDLVDLLWETVAELNTSHAYVMPTEPPGAQERKLGLLGADLSPAADGWRIDRVLPGESSEPDARSPLRAAGVDARAGDLIVAVDGRGVDRHAGPARGLVGAAEKPVELILRRDGSDRRVVVVPLGDEEVLRYQDWVRSRREYVAEHSGGRLGYLHVPDMMSYGWAQLHRDLRIASRAEALIADVRYNRGGHTSQLVVARLAAKVVSWGTGRHYARASTYPAHAPRGPVVLVANEHSGSDGDIVNAAAQAMGIGPVVGMRTWGGVVGIDGRFDLVDGTTVTQPRYATWMKGKGWGMENYGVDPDIEVEHTPADFFGAADPQLDRAIAEALDLLEREGSEHEPPLPEPKVRRRL
ncbi:S41 family peptidase [Pseudactinotalea sp. Z1748]|uniref:S41 family peptidase n=1 Tax=Pseudactinotalea sp. Z1748 TaxID=3413027 RepID=UPI003C7CFBB3